MTFPMMTLPTPTYNPKTANRIVKKAGGGDYYAEIGADNGMIYNAKYPGYVYVRETLSYDPSLGSVTGGQTYLVRGHHNFLPNYGIRVRVRYDAFIDDWFILGNDPDSLIEQGIDPNSLNQLNPFTNFVDTLQITPLLSYAVATGGSPATEISVKNFSYLDHLGAHKLFRLESLNRPDLADYEPAANTKRLVHFWLNHDLAITASQGTPIDAAADFQPDTHLTEVLQDRPDQLATPIGAWWIANGATTITPSNRYMFDTRPWLNTQQYAGFPNPVARNYIVPAGVSEIVADKLTVTAKLTITGKLTIAATPVASPTPVIGPIHLPCQALHNSVAETATTLSYAANIGGGICLQATPADAQTVFRSRAYLTPGVYKVRALYGKSTNYGKFKVSAIGPMTATTALVDGYAGSGSYNNVADDDVTITLPGEYRLDVIVDGKNASSSDYYVVIQSITITKQ